MIVVSGVPRSGTSVCMDIQRAVHGEDMILGSKFPQENKNRKRIEPKTPIQKYIREQSEKFREENEKPFDYKDLNPNGFWECIFTVQGIRYRQALKKLFERIKKERNLFCKIVCSGLIPSDPDYIDKIIFTLRDPHSVAKSQERLKNSAPDAEIAKHSPRMFISNIVQASKFFLDNPDIPVFIYNYEDLMENPKEVIDKMQDFLKFGDYSKAYNVVNPKLQRSHEDNIKEDAMFEDAEHIYELFKQHKFQEIVDYMKDPKRITNRIQRSWMCLRMGKQVTEHMCKACKSSEDTRRNFIDNAKLKGINFLDQPCAFDCGMNLDAEPISVEESIKNNHWKKEPALYDIDYQKEVLQKMVDKKVKGCEIERQKKWIQKLSELFG